MTDRYFALTVILEKHMRSDDAQPIIDAIKMIKCVSDVKPLISEPDLYFAQEKAKMELKMKLFN